MDDFITIYYWARLAVLLLVTVVAVIATIGMTARRTFKPWREIVVTVLVVANFVALSVIPGVHYGVVWAAVLAVLGVAAGYLLNGGRRLEVDGARVVARRSPFLPWLWFVAVVLTLSTLLFAEAYLFELTVLLMAFVTGGFIGQTVALLRAPRPVGGAAVIAGGETAETGAAGASAA